MVWSLWATLLKKRKVMHATFMPLWLDLAVQMAGRQRKCVKYLWYYDSHSLENQGNLNIYKSNDVVTQVDSFSPHRFPPSLTGRCRGRAIEWAVCLRNRNLGVSLYSRVSTPHGDHLNQKKDWLADLPFIRGFDFRKSQKKLIRKILSTYTQ